MRLLKFLFPIFSLCICAHVFTGCSENESEPELEVITYTCDFSEDLLKMVNVIVLYTNHTGSLIPEKINSCNWKKTINMRRPFNAEMKVKYSPKMHFLPQKEYYNLYRKLTINKSESLSQDFVSSRLLHNFIDNLCAKNEHIFFEVR